MSARKVMILGAIGVGKTSLANRLAFERFEASYKATIGVDIYTTSVPLPGASMPLILWDTDGDFGMAIFRTVYIKGASAALVVGDATRPASIEHMAVLIDGVRDALPGRPCAAVINKCDLLDPDDRRSGVATAGLHKADMLAVTSARTGAGVREVLAELATTIQRRTL